MSARVTTAVTDDGRVLACKRATDAEGRARLRREASVLTKANHPGVVELASCDDDGEVTTLYTFFSGTHTLETLPSPALPRAAAIVAMTASTVADLHRLGVVHGRLDPSHVLIGAGARPVLCGFAGGGEIGETPPPGPEPMPEFRDPAAPAGTPLAPASDVYALGALLRVLAITEEADGDPIPERRFQLGLRRPRPWTGYLRRALLTLADHATDPEPRRRPSANRFAGDIQELVPDAAEMLRTPRTTTVMGGHEPPNVSETPGTVDRPRRRARARLVTLAGGVGGLVLVFWAFAALRSGGGAAASASGTTAVAPSSTESDAASTMPPSTPPPADGTAEYAGHRYAIGEPGDRIAVGDWNCDGIPSAALVRPSTGDVFVFDGWPPPGAELRATASTTVAGAVDVRVESTGSCSTLYAVRADGSELAIRL